MIRNLLLIAIAGYALATTVIAQPGDPHSAPAPAPSAVVVPALDRDLQLPTLLGSLSADEQEYFQHIVTLTSPFFEGRGPGTRGNERAAEYIEFYFRKLGLQPAFPILESSEKDAPVTSPFASYTQQFRAGSTLTVTAAGLSINGQAAALDSDFSVLGTSGSAEFEGPLAFAGFGIERGKDKYNSFGPGEANESLFAGKAVLVLRYEPFDGKGRSQWGEGGAWTDASSLRAKLRAVSKRGPGAIILVSPPGVDDARANILENAESTRQGAKLDVPVIMVNAATGERLAQAAGTTLADLTARANTLAAETSGIVELPKVTVSINTQTKSEPLLVDNIGAIIRGKGELASSYILVGAHMDHLGYGSFGSRGGAKANGVLHPGADDNASGLAGILQLASEMSTAYAALPVGSNTRSIMFVAFNAEESGLIGSRYMVSHMPVPASSVYAMLNMDMIGRVRYNKIDISGVATAKGFADVLAPLFTVEASGLKVRTLPGGRGPSDHASFFGANIPVLHFFSGVSDEYHMPSDLYPTVNIAGGVRSYKLCGTVAMMLATRTESLDFESPTGPSIFMEQPKPDEPKPAASANPPGPGDNKQAQGLGGMGGVKVRFGIAPGNYDDDKPGVDVGEVYPKTSAADAGILKGDRLISWNGKPLKSVEDWMPLLTGANPGDKVDIELVRDDKTIKVIVTLKGREPTDR